MTVAWWCCLYQLCKYSKKKRNKNNKSTVTQWKKNICNKYDQPRICIQNTNFLSYMFSKMNSKPNLSCLFLTLNLFNGQGLLKICHKFLHEA